MDNRPIGVFDSGLGGLTAVKTLREILPGEDIVFLGEFFKGDKLSWIDRFKFYSSLIFY